QKMRVHDIKVSWRPDGRQLAVNTSNNWQILDCDDWSTVVEHPHPVPSNEQDHSDIEWNSNGTLLAYSRRNVIEIWDPEQGTVVERLPGNYESVASLSWHPDGTKLLTGDNKAQIKILPR